MPDAVKEPKKQSDLICRDLRQWGVRMYGAGWVHLTDEMEKIATHIEELEARIKTVTADRPFITGHNDGYALALEHVYDAFTDTTPSHTDEVEAFSDRLALLREPVK